jgi:hypothetical protein
MEDSSELWIAALLTTLRELERDPAAPTGDIRWLIDRCEQTLAYKGAWLDWRKASIEQLVPDLSRFSAEHPGLLPDHLLSPSSFGKRTTGP